MWLEALDLVLLRLKEKVALERVRGVSGSCQQHGSVYWREGAAQKLQTLTAERTLVEQLADALSHPYAPNWQDHSTGAEVEQFNARLGSSEKLAEVTGSGAHHVSHFTYPSRTRLRAPGMKRGNMSGANDRQRFTGPQIMRLKRKLPHMYANTERIALVSSFLASVLLGTYAPMDISDACGMNLWDIAANTWSEPLLELTAGKDGVAALREKLGPVRLDGGGSMGSIAPYFVTKYGFSPECQVAPFTGDNPATILALPLRPLDAIVSLGTSTTFLMSTPYYKPSAAYHFFNHPTTPGQYMFMLCYKNGGLAREKVRDTLPKPDGADPWANFNKAVSESRPLSVNSPNDRPKLGLYFYLPEIVPNIRAGTWRYTCKPDGTDLRAATETWSAQDDARAIVESQALSMRMRSRSLVDAPSGGLPPQPRRIYLVGGGSLNPSIAQTMGEVLGGAEGVYRLDVGGNACALGGAYKAVWAMERKEGESFDELIGKRWKEDGAIQKVDVGYRDGVFQTYGDVLGAFGQMEEEISRG